MQRTANMLMGLGTSVLLGSLLVACPETHLLNDVSFDMWCGKQLCAWDVDAGEVRKVATWHARDSGVELVGSPAQISQVTETEDVDCIRFELIANVEASARASVQLDFNADGTIDFEQVIPTQKWEPSEFLIRAPERYDGIRFVVRKAGPGRAVVAQVGAVSAETAECGGERLVLGPQGAGAACEDDRDCSEGVCAGGYCSACASDGSCAVGESCDVDAHCGGEKGCGYGFCDGCTLDADCGEGQACAFVDPRKASPRECVERTQLEPAIWGGLCNGEDQCGHGYTCGATDATIAPRCGVACSGPEDDACGSDERCRLVLTAITEALVFEAAFLCASDADCEAIPFACIE
jgi:hypothetical protein